MTQQQDQPPEDDEPSLAAGAAGFGLIDGKHYTQQRSEICERHDVTEAVLDAALNYATEAIAFYPHAARRAGQRGRLRVVITEQWPGLPAMRLFFHIEDEYNIQLDWLEVVGDEDEPLIDEF